MLHSGDTLLEEINGLVAGTQYDQFVVNGTVSLGGTALDTGESIIGSVGFGDSVKIIDNDGTLDPVTGTFFGLANGTTVTLNGQLFQIFYDGGDGNDVTLTRIPTAPPPNVVFVDDDWSIYANGVDADGPAGGSLGNGSAIGYDQFNTIQEALNAVAAGGTVYVYAGTYVEALTINKTLSLLGIQQGVDARMRVGAEAVIEAPMALDALVEVSANGVVIDGFTVDGDDQAFRDIRVNEVDGVHVVNNIVTGAVRGVQYNGATAGNTGGLVEKNKIENLTVDASGSYGVLAFDASYASVMNNTMNGLDVGIFEQYFYQPNAGNAANVISGNVITAALLGYGTNERSAAASTTALSNNVYHIGLGGVGVQLYNIYKMSGITLNNETIDGAASVGVYAFISGGSASITGGSITSTAGSIGVQLTNYLTDFAYAATGDGDVLIDSVDISNFAVGVMVEDDSLGAFNIHATITNDTQISGATTAGILVTGPQASADIINNNGSIHGNVIGIDVNGGSATISGNHIFNNGTGIRFTDSGSGSVSGNNFDGGVDPDNATDLLIDGGAGTVTIGAANSFAGDTLFIDNPSTQSFNLTGANTQTYEDLNPATLADNFGIEDKMHHRVDTDLAVTNGLITWVTGNVYITTPGIGSTDSTIQRGVDAASSGNTVNVESGLYLESNILIDKPLTVLGQSRTSTVLAPAAADSHEDDSFSGVSLQQAFVVAASNVTISTMTIDGDGNVSLSGSNNFRSGIITPDDGIDRSNLLFTNLNVKNIYRRGIQISWAGDSNEVSNNLIEQSSGTLSAGGAAVAVFGGNVGATSATLVLNNEITNVIASGIISNFGAKLDIRGNDITSTPLGMNLAALDDGSSIGGPAVVDKNTIDMTGLASADIGILVTFSGDSPFNPGAVMIQGNDFIGSGGDAGIWAFRTGASPLRILSNTFTSAGSTVGGTGQGAGIFITDDDELLGESSTDNNANVEIQGNTITGFQYGVHVRAVDDEGPAETLSVLVGGPNPADNNHITGSGAAGSKGIFVEDSADASIAKVKIQNNNMSVGVFAVGVDIDGGIAMLDGNDLNGNTIGLLIHDNAIVDAGQAGVSLPTDYTGLGISTGDNDFSGYTAAASAASGAIVNLNTDVVGGRQGAPPDVTAYGNYWAVNTPNGIENVVWHDSDNASLGFVDFTSFSGLTVSLVSLPTITTSQSVNEGTTETVHGSFSDVPQAHTVTIQWGDGTPDTAVALPSGVFSFDISHFYADDVNGPPTFSTFALAVSVTEDVENPTPVHVLSDSSLSVTVNDVAPTVTLVGPASAITGDTKHYSFTTSDPANTLMGNHDTFSIVSITGGAFGTVVPGSLVFDPATGTGSFDVTFSTPPGPNTSVVRVQLQDDDNAQSNVSAVMVSIANTLQVTSFQNNNSGFDVTFNRCRI